MGYNYNDYYYHSFIPARMSGLEMLYSTGWLFSLWWFRGSKNVPFRLEFENRGSLHPKPGGPKALNPTETRTLNPKP